MEWAKFIINVFELIALFTVIFYILDKLVYGPVTRKELESEGKGKNEKEDKS